MVSLHRLDETAPAQLRVACDQGKALCARGRGDNAVDWVPREVLGELHDEERHGGRDVLDHHARFLDQPCQRRLRRSAEPEAVMRHQPGQLQEADGRDGEPAWLESSIDGRPGWGRESVRTRAEPKPGVGVEKDHRVALCDCGRARFRFRGSWPKFAAQGRRAMSHFSNGGKTAVFSTSPMIVKRSAMQPNTSFLGSSGGTSFATGFPFLVMTTGVRYFLTSSITRRHRALNSPAGIVFMVSSMGSWSQHYDHDSIGSSHGGQECSRRAPRQQRAESVMRSRTVPLVGSYSKSFPPHWNRGGLWKSASTAALSGGH